MSLSAVVMISALTWAAENTATSAVGAIRRQLRNGAAKKELAAISARAIEAAIAIEPAFAEDFRSESFLRGLIGPAVVENVADPTSTIDASDLAESYLQRFVDRFARDDDRRGALASIWQTDSEAVTAALTEFVNALRKALIASEHWKEVGRDQTLEQIRSAVSRIDDRLAADLPRARSDAVDLRVAKADARVGSQDLLDWPRTIEGLFMERPELDRIMARIQTEPRGRTLLIGEAGSGKSALLSQLASRLQESG
ncbi:MAG: hypothetical protein PS018_14725, partial [bacterium]|nr:hypothetical protein [bacterium]